ncbi:MAG: SET domain-containing protein-lysine N-methyltransferase [Deltaproteobacteria bacterium]|nr:SET domain-containing protein-lysine N-methyltransferase [Deltaproteobacteria bacterium]
MTRKVSILVVKGSAISGRGVFATQPIKKGQRIHLMRGKRMTMRAMFRAVDDGLENSADPLLIADGQYLDLNELSRTFNHSCNPNAFLRRQCTLTAIRNILRGEEITYDYSTSMVDGEKIRSLGHPVWTCRCKCGAPNCVGIIDQFQRLPARRRAYYLKNRYAPDFVLRKFAGNR